MLNAKLSEKARNLELAEEQIWELFASYMMLPWEGEVGYQDDFSILDEEDEYKKLEIARRAATGPEALAVIDQMIINLVTEDIDENPSDNMADVPLTQTPAAAPAAPAPAAPALRPRTYIGNQQ
jgi:hypothetical protein